MSRLNAKWYNFWQRGQKWYHFWQDRTAKTFTTPQWISASAAATSIATSVSPAKPVGLVAGQALVALVHHYEFRTVTAPAGFVKVRNGDTSGNNDGFDVWVKYATASDVAASNFTFSVPAVEWLTVTLHAVDNIDLSFPPTVAVQDGDPAGDPVTAPTITTPDTNSIIFWGFFYYQDLTSPVTYTKGNLAASYHDATNAAACWDTYDIIGTAASTSGSVFTTSENHQKRAHTVAFRPLRAASASRSPSASKSPSASISPSSSVSPSFSPSASKSPSASLSPSASISPSLSCPSDDFAGTGALSGNWTVFAQAGGGSITRVGGQAVDPTTFSSASAAYTGQSFANNQYSELRLVTMNSASGAPIGPMVRMSADAANGYQAVCVTGQAVSLSAVGGTGFVGTFSGTPVNGDVVRLVAVGNTFRLYINGILDATTLTDSQFTSGYPGFWMGYSSGTQPVADDWVGCDFLGSASLSPSSSASPSKSPSASLSPSASPSPSSH